MPAKLFWSELERIFSKKERDENPKEKMICKGCGNDMFRVYCTVAIDDVSDARFYCTKCGKDLED